MVENNEENQEELPPGFRFDPTDEELVLSFLYPKLTTFTTSHLHHHHLIPEVDFHAFSDPCQLILQGGAFESYGQWYFFTRKKDKHITQNGYWIEVDMGLPIFGRNSNKLVGLKKILEFYFGKFPSGVKTGWLLQEYHICINNIVSHDLRHKTTKKHPDMNKWVLCRIQEKCNDNNSHSLHEEEDESSDEIELSYLDQVFLSNVDQNDLDEINSPY